MVPLFLLNRLLSEGHILHVFLESVERGVWFHTYTIVMIFGVPSARQNPESEHTLTESQCEVYSEGQKRRIDKGFGRLGFR